MALTSHPSDDDWKSGGVDYITLRSAPQVIDSQPPIATPQVRSLVVTWTKTGTVRHGESAYGDDSGRIEALEQKIAAFEAGAVIEDRARTQRELEAMLGAGAAVLAYVAASEDGVAKEGLSREFGPDDWFALARLMRAGFVEDDGISICATEAGEVAAIELLAMLNSIEG